MRLFTPRAFAFFLTCYMSTYVYASHAEAGLSICVNPGDIKSIVTTKGELSSADQILGWDPSSRRINYLSMISENAKTQSAELIRVDISSFRGTPGAQRPQPSYSLIRKVDEVASVNALRIKDGSIFIGDSCYKQARLLNRRLQNRVPDPIPAAGPEIIFDGKIFIKSRSMRISGFLFKKDSSMGTLESLKSVFDSAGGNKGGGRGLSGQRPLPPGAFQPH